MQDSMPDAGYDEEARYFEEGVRNTTGQGLKAKALDLLKPSFQHQLTFLRDAALHHVTTSLAQEHVTQRFAEVSCTYVLCQSVCTCLSRPLPAACRPAKRCAVEAMAGSACAQHAAVVMTAHAAIWGCGCRVRQEALNSFAKGAQDAIVTSSDWDASAAATQLQVDIDAQIKHQEETQACPRPSCAVKQAPLPCWSICMYVPCTGLCHAACLCMLYCWRKSADHAVLLGFFAPCPHAKKLEEQGPKALSISSCWMIAGR